MIYDCIVVGAGPAGLFFASELLRTQPEKNLALLDAGVSLLKRGCPLVDNGHCSQCRTCLAVYGSGGAGMYSDGKLSSFPAGSGLARHFGNDDTVIMLNSTVLDEIENRVIDFGAKRSSSANSAASPLARSSIESGAQLKSYDVVHLGTEGIQEFCARFEAEIEAAGATFKWRHRMRSIGRFKDGYEIICTHPKHGEIALQTHNVVLATGKASGTLIRQHFAELGVAYLENQIELGVRVETARKAIDPLASCHLDAKLKFVGSGDAEVRTFCVCDGGYLVSCYYEDFLDGKQICTISGFSFKNSHSENSNFGLLVRKKFPKHIDPIKIQLGFVESINTASGHGGTVVQRYEDFLANRATTSEQLDVNRVQTTLASSQPADLNWLLPGYVVANVRSGMERLGQISSMITDRDTLLHAPVWELIHDRPVLTNSFETTAPGVYVIGDATGIARGIVQAASTGLWAARWFNAKGTRNQTWQVA